MTSQGWCGRIGTKLYCPVSTCCPRVGRAVGPVIWELLRSRTGSPGTLDSHQRRWDGGRDTQGREGNESRFIFWPWTLALPGQWRYRSTERKGGCQAVSTVWSVGTGFSLLSGNIVFQDVKGSVKVTGSSTVTKDLLRTWAASVTLESFVYLCSI